MKEVQKSENEVDKRELFEQQLKIFEAGAQRADKRTGSFSFLTWPFFIAPLIANDEFLAATFKSAAAEEDSKATPAGAAQVTNDDPPARDSAKTSAADETAKGPPVASSEAHAAQFDQTQLAAQPHEDAPKTSTIDSEPSAAASGGGGGGGGGGSGGGNDADSHQHDAETPIEDSSVHSPLAASHVGSSQVFGFVQSNIFGESFSPSMIGSAPLFGTVGTLAHDVDGALAPVTTAVQPVLTTVSDTAGALAHHVVGTLVPVEAAVQPVLATVSDTVGTLAHDVAGTLAPVTAVVQPVLTTVSDTVGTLAHDVAGTLAPVTTAAQPVLTSVSDTVDPLAHDVVSTLAPVTTAAQPVLTSVSDTVDPLAHDVVDTLAPVTTAVQPVLTTVSDITGALTHDVAGNNASAMPDTSTGQAAGPADTLLALATSAAPIEAPGSATSTLANVVTDASNAAAVVHPTTLAADAIALNDAPPPPAHALFAGNQYTDYGVTLSTDIAVAPQHAVSQAESVSPQDTLVPVVADAQKHVPPPPDIVDTTHPIDHLGHAIL